MAPRDKSGSINPDPNFKEIRYRKKKKKNVFAGLSMTAVATKRRVAEMSVSKPQQVFFAEMKRNLKTVPLGRVTLTEGSAWTYTLQRFLEGAFWKNCCQRGAKWRSELVRKRKAILSLGFSLFGFAWAYKFGLRHVKTWVC